jgi:ankyrin repeat protein
LINAYPRSAQVCDDDGYLPLHTALDSAGQDLDLVQLLLEVYPLSVREPTANGWLPLHVALSSDGANETVIQRLLNLYPEAAVATATDLVVLNGLTPLQQRHYRDASIDNPGAIIVIE